MSEFKDGYTNKTMYGIYGKIYDQFKENTGISSDMIIDWRPAANFYTDLGVDIKNAIVIQLWSGGWIIYTPDKEFKVEK